MIAAEMAPRAREPVQVRHQARCASREGRRCDCEPSYRTRVRDLAGAPIYSGWRKTRAEVVAWRQEALLAVKRGQLKKAPSMTVEAAGNERVEGMRSGLILTRSGEGYKPSAVRSYEAILRRHVNPELADRKLGTLRRADIQDFVEHLRGKGLAPATVHNALDPLRVMTRRALDRGDLLVDPFQRLALPTVRNHCTRVEAPDRALTLIEALPPDERAFWALAFFAGLRRGELRALQCRDLDFECELIKVRSSWDPVEGEIEPKSLAGTRQVPMSRDPLRAILRAHKLKTGRHRKDLFLGRTETLPFIPSTVRNRALSAWQKAGLREITAHEARHCAASYFIACGWDWKKVSEYLGHSDVRTTYNRYGKIVPGDAREAASQLDAYIAKHRNAG